MEIYRLKTGLPCRKLMHAVSQCRGQVLLRTARGDTLDLTSELSRFVFVSAFGNTNLVLNATVALTEPEDYASLASCLITPAPEGKRF